ncbi:hypothetical protein [Stieleria neptunia]|nr:hypothetical protein [Stieleria neptunia]
MTDNAHATVNSGYGLVRTTVMLQVGLFVAVDVGRANVDLSNDRLLANC